MPFIYEVRVRILDLVLNDSFTLSAGLLLVQGVLFRTSGEGNSPFH